MLAHLEPHHIMERTNHITGTYLHILTMLLITNLISLFLLKEVCGVTVDAWAYIDLDE